MKGKSKIGCYIRVSTRDQNLDGQRIAIEAWLERNEITSVKWYIDKSTGDNLDRSGMDQLREDIKAGKITTVICYKLDRLSRKLTEGLSLISGWLDGGVRVVSTSQDLDFSGITGRLVASVLFAVSEMEQETRRERQADGIEAAKRRGVYQGRKPGSVKVNGDRVKELRKTLTVEDTAKVLGISVRSVYSYQK